MMFRANWLLKPVSSALGRVSEEDQVDFIMRPVSKKINLL
jgi:hypothetical protein